MTINDIKRLIKESITEVIEESSCPMCGESIYETEKKCNCSEEVGIDNLKNQLKSKLDQLNKM
jgi:predicted nucleic acid-binding Zn ribbon protein